MKKYKAYKSIRKEAEIWGLKLPYFLILLIVFITTAFIIIFEFSYITLLIFASINTLNYFILLKLSLSNNVLVNKNVYPKNINNKYKSPYKYPNEPQ